MVVAYAQERELPRTIRSLTSPHQRSIASDDVEVIVVDNGSPRPLAAAIPHDLASAICVHRIEDASRSPARAANVGLGLAAGELVGLVVDGARMASPRLLSTALLASRLSDRAVITAPAWHLGAAGHDTAGVSTHDAVTEDALLDSVAWPSEGYALFSISTPAPSSGRGLFGPMGESSSLFMRRELWAELGGLDERFELPGGGMVNHDLYRRACCLPDAQLVVLLGEGTFHQTHGGASTSGFVGRESMRAEYEAICGQPHRPPSNRALYVGSLPSEYLDFVGWSIEAATARTPRPFADVPGDGKQP